MDLDSPMSAQPTQRTLNGVGNWASLPWTAASEGTSHYPPTLFQILQGHLC